MMTSTYSAGWPLSLSYANILPRESVYSVDPARFDSCYDEFQTMADRVVLLQLSNYHKLFSESDFKRAVVIFRAPLIN